MEQIQKNKKNFNRLLIILLIGLIIFAILTHRIFEGVLIIFYIIISIVLLAVYYYMKITVPFKETVIPAVLQKYKPTLSFSYKLDEKDHYVELIKNNHLIPSATSFNFADVIVDEVDGYKTLSADLHATHTQSTGKTTTTITDFKGRFYDVEFDKLPCNFIIKEEYYKRNPSGYEFLEFEHIDFNKVFNIYVSDTHEAFKVFTPSIIKKYHELAGVDEYKTILHYENNHLYIYIYNAKNIFEYTNDDYEKIIIKDYLDQYNDILKYIETFQYQTLD